jgi:hypothetical protein
MTIECERYVVPTIIEKRYDPALGVGSQTWEEEVTINMVVGRVRALRDLSASASNAPNETYTLEENKQRVAEFLAGALNNITPTTPDDLLWVDVAPWQAVRHG